MNKYEQLIEFILNEQEDKAKALFHEIVVETSRGIYENLIDEDDLSEVGGNQVEDLVDEITMDEEGMAEDDELGMDDMGDGDDGMGDDMDMDGDDHHADVGGEEELEDRVMDLEDALDELKAEFDALMGDQGGEESGEEDFGADDEGVEDMMEADDEEDLEESADEDDDEMDESVQEAKMSKKDKMLKDKKEPKKMTEAEWIREYVEKIGEYPGELKNPTGKNVGAGTGDNEQQGETNTKSVVAGKNDMGGTTANIAKGGAESDPDNKPVPQPNNQYTKGKGNLPGAGQFKNVPGAKGDSFKSKAPSAKTGEEGGVNKKSIEG